MGCGGFAGGRKGLSVYMTGDVFPGHDISLFTRHIQPLKNIFMKKI